MSENMNTPDIPALMSVINEAVEQTGHSFLKEGHFFKCCRYCGFSYVEVYKLAFQGLKQVQCIGPDPKKTSK